jgi:hypothetical protein
MNIAKLTYHVIEMDFRNELGQHVFVITCPVVETTVALVGTSVCVCGHKI